MKIIKITLNQHYHATLLKNSSCGSICRFHRLISGLLVVKFSFKISLLEAKIISIFQITMNFQYIILAFKRMGRLHVQNYMFMILPFISLQCCYGGWNDDREESKFIFEVVNNSNDEIWITISEFFPDTKLPAPCGYTWEVKPKSEIEYAYYIDRDEIFELCDKLQVFFLDVKKGIPYDDSIVLQRREYTREQLDSCGWVIVYE